MKILATALLLALPLLASEKVKVDKLSVRTLPAETYAKLEKAKRLSLIWRDPSFDPSRGFKPGDLEWKAENRVGEVATYLKEQLATFGTTKEGAYILELAITEAQAGDIGYTWNKTGYFILEGRVKDAEGKIVAAFVTKEEDEFAGMAKSLKPGVDRALSGISSELFRR